MNEPSTSLNPLPKHVAIIMDGNGRWARARRLPRAIGHREGVKSVRRTVECCLEEGIGALTLFAFSSENWRRPSEEVNMIMDLFMNTLKKEVGALDRNDVRLRFIGDRTAFSSSLQQLIAESEAQTTANRKLELVIAANYGGQWDISQAARRLGELVHSGKLKPEEITTERLAQEICLAELSLPDLFIRTGGERRISNFLLWQLAYTELYFTDILWPEFDQDEFNKALEWYSNRQRRFGRTGEQVEQLKGA